MKRRHPHPKRRRRDAARQRELPKTLDVALRLYREGRIREAIDVCRQVVAQSPDQAEPAHLLGILLARSGDPQAGEKWLRASLQIRPDYAAAWNDLGNVYSDQGRLEEAESAYRQAIECDAAYAVAHNNLAIVYKNRGRFEEAQAAYERAIELRPDYADAWQNLGLLLKRLERYEEAAVAFQRVLQLEPARTEAHKDLYGAWRAAGRMDEARAALNAWLRREPDHPVARHLMAALVGGDQTPPRASDQYVQEVFDRFADTFDEELAQLHYRGPQLIASALAEHLGPPRGDLAILDAGCGTGLCAPVLRPYACTLVGVDLSPQMLEKAREKQLFDQLESAELTGYLIAHPEAWDLIVACDTLNYFGHLEPVFAGASRSLRVGGRLVFTLEQEADEASDEGFFLHSTGRYGHRATYVEQALASVNLTVLSTTSSTLRTEADQPVRGLLFVVQRPSR